MIDFLITAVASATLAHAQPIDEYAVEAAIGAKAMFSERLDRHYLGDPRGVDFFRRAGYMDGCNTYNSHKQSVEGHYYSSFRSALVKMLQRELPAGALERVVQTGTLDAETEAKIATLGPKIDQATAPAMKKAMEHLFKHTLFWVDVAVPKGGFERGVIKGTPFWYDDVSGIPRICAIPPRNRGDAMKVWLKGAE